MPAAGGNWAKALEERKLLACVRKQVKTRNR
jgi:hypothetical protein